MAIPDDKKRQLMNAVSHPETREQMRSLYAKEQLRGLKQAAGNALPAGVKQQAKSVVTGMQAVAQVGVLRGSGGIALYMARIREADRDAQRGVNPPNAGKMRRGMERG